MSSLLDSLKDQLTPDLLRSLSSNLGESGDSVQKAVLSGSATMLATVAAKAQEPGFLGQIMNLISGFNNRATMGATAGGGSATVSSPSQSGNTFLSTLFGGSMSTIQDRIAEVSGIRVSSAGSLLSTAAPMVLGLLSSRVVAQGLSGSGLVNMLQNEMPSLRSFLPAGLSIPGLSNLTSRASTVATQAQSTARNWLWPIIALVVILAAIFWFLSRNSASVNNAANSAANGAANLGAFVKASLPGGVDLNIPQNGMESKLLLYIQDPNAPVNDQTWFEFDRLTFDTGSANLQAASQEQLQNIANILKAYPNVKVRIGGYTDNTGSADANLRLSQNRADNVTSQLANLGVDSSRMDAKGYGEDHPVADNSTEQGRAQNRRIALHVTQK
jgi:OmpA-OmpF porin, OOP family